MAMAMVVKVGVVLLVVLAQVVHGAAKTYQVQWDFPQQELYFNAVQGKTYNVGDTLIFNYTPGVHNVVKVGSFDDFDKCTMSMPLSPVYTDGMTPITLDQPGDHYVICSFPGHCTDGMKIKVLAKVKKPKAL